MPQKLRWFGLMLWVGVSLAVSGQVLLQDNGEPGSGVAWTATHFRGTTVMSIQSVVAEGNRALALRFATAGEALDSCFANLKPVADLAAGVTVSFRYQTQAAPLPLMVALSSSPGCCAPAIKQYPKLVADGKWHEVTLPYRLAGFARDGLVLEFIMEGAVKAGDELLLDDISVRQTPPEVVGVHWLSPGSRMVYDQTPNQQAVLMLVSRERPVDFEVAVSKDTKDTDAAPLFHTTQQVRGTGRATVDFSSYPVGGYRITVRGNGQSWQWPVTKQPYQAEAVLIRDQVPYVNGQPFFTIGLFHAGDRVLQLINEGNQAGQGDGRLDREAMLASIKERGFNTVHHSWAAASKEYHESARRFGLHVISEVGLNPDPATIGAIQRQPNVFGWYAADEPPASLAAACEKAYYALKKQDPYHPVMSAFVTGGVGYDGHCLVDIALPDLYPIKDARSNVAGTAAYVRNCRSVLNRDDPTTSVIVVPQLFTADAQWNGFEPTYDQVRAQVYTALTAGAKGVFYYGYFSHEKLTNGMSLNPRRKHWFLPESRLWNRIGGLNAELQALSEALLFGEDLTPAITCTPATVLARAVTLSGNRLYLLVVNPAGAAAGPVRITGLPAVKSVTPLFGSAPLDPKGRTCELPAYGVGVYKMMIK